MSAGQRIVFGMAFVQALQRGASRLEAALLAAAAVKCLRDARAAVPAGADDEDVSVLLDDMLGVPR